VNCCVFGLSVYKAAACILRSCGSAQHMCVQIWCKVEEVVCFQHCHMAALCRACLWLCARGSGGVFSDLVQDGCCKAAIHLNWFPALHFTQQVCCQSTYVAACGCYCTHESCGCMWVHASATACVPNDSKQKGVTLGSHSKAETYHIPSHRQSIQMRVALLPPRFRALSHK
jgi:hypothetical protein